MKKIFLILTMVFSLLFSFDLEVEGVEVTYTNDNDDEKTIVIKRDKPTQCKEIDFSPKMILGGSYASQEISNKCKKTFVTAVGKISPIKFSKNIDTFGELEVLKFIEDAKSNKNMLLIDSRTPEWFFQQTIPTAVNVPYTYLSKSQFAEEFDEMLEILGVKITNNSYDFTNAKELLLFCNGVWCGQSPVSMKKLMKLGYPEDKLNWYRGGIQSWLSLNLPVIQP